MEICAYAIQFSEMRVHAPLSASLEWGRSKYRLGRPSASSILKKTILSESSHILESFGLFYLSVSYINLCEYVRLLLRTCRLFLENEVWIVQSMAGCLRFWWVLELPGFHFEWDGQTLAFVVVSSFSSSWYGPAELPQLWMFLFSHFLRYSWLATWTRSLHPYSVA